MSRSYSLNVPVPGRVSRIASDLAPYLAPFDSIRERHTLVCKRFGTRTAAEYDRLEPAVRRAIAGSPAFEVRVTHVDVFREPPRGPAPVVYLAVESPFLRSLHDRLCEAFDPADDLEGDAYVPHVTLARGGDCAAVDSILAVDVEPVTWSVTHLVLWDGRESVAVADLSLPA